MDSKSCTSSPFQIQLTIELLWPLFLFVILIAVRHSHPPYKQSQCRCIKTVLLIN